jgi:hypothetical protein
VRASGWVESVWVVGGRKCHPDGTVQVVLNVGTERFPSRDSTTPGVRALIAPEGVIARVFQSGALPA